MAEMTPAPSFAFSPKGPYSLAASIRYLEGFAPAAYDSESATSLEMAFCVDGYWDPPTADPRLARAMTIAYNMKAPPSASDIAEISESWKPYRTWVALLLRIMLEDETHDIARQGIARSPGV